MGELADTLADRAASEGFLDFDPDHSFWGQFSREEARALIRALAGMGFRFDEREGWVGGRRPGPGELAVALAYCGYDARGIRGLPSGGELDNLFRGGQVATVEYLAQYAPALALDQVTALLGDRAEQFAELWNTWGHMRPILFSAA